MNGSRIVHLSASWTDFRIRSARLVIFARFIQIPHFFTSQYLEFEIIVSHFKIKSICCRLLELNLNKNTIYSVCSIVPKRDDNI